MGDYTNFDKVNGVEGLYVGTKGSEVNVATAAGTLKQTGTTLTPTGAELNALAGIATGKFIVGERFDVTYPQVAAADVAKTFFIAPAACKIVSAYERHVTVAGQAGVLTIEKLTAAQAPGAGGDCFTTGWDLTSTANTSVSKTAVTTAVGTLAAGDALCLKVQSGAATSYALGTITLTMQWV